MKSALKGLLLTAFGWLVLVGMYALIETVRGNVPFAMMQWNAGGKFLTITILVVLGIGALAGYAGERVRQRPDNWR